MKSPPLEYRESKLEIDFRWKTRFRKDGLSEIVKKKDVRFMDTFELLFYWTYKFGKRRPRKWWCVGPLLPLYTMWSVATLTINANSLAVKGEGSREGVNRKRSRRGAEGETGDGIGAGTGIGGWGRGADISGAGAEARAEQTYK